MKTNLFIQKTLGLFLFALLVSSASSCHKEGVGGTAGITGTVYHHEQPIPNCVVYIKFDATDFPGELPSDYNISTTADASGHFEFARLYKGNYYLFGKGYDTKIQAVVKGGVPVNIKRNKVVEQDVPVTED